MSVYTSLSNDQFSAFCQAFGVQFVNAVPITQGIKNSNWFIQTTDDLERHNNETPYSYVFTLFEERPPADIEKMATVVNTLSNYLPVAAPLAKTQLKADGTPDYLIHYEDKAILLVPCLAGTHPKHTTPSMCHKMGTALATLHTTLQELTPMEAYGVPLYPWDTVYERERQFMPSDEAKLMQDIWQSYDGLPLDDLPKGLCHLDMFADNTLWDLTEGKVTLTGLLDFTEVSVEHYVMDIAITINDFCTTWGDAQDGESVNFDRQKMQAFIDGYETKRSLSDAERQALPVMLAMAAVTFWLLRLNVIHYNREQGRTGDNIMVKNPDLMKRLAAYHWSHVEALRNEPQIVYILQHSRTQNSASSSGTINDDDDHNTDTNTETNADKGTNIDDELLGVFASEAQALDAIETLKDKPNFKDHPHGFDINPYRLGQIKQPVSSH